MLKALSVALLVVCSLGVPEGDSGSDSEELGFASPYASLMGESSLYRAAYDSYGISGLAYLRRRARNPHGLPEPRVDSFQQQSAREALINNLPKYPFPAKPNQEPVECPLCVEDIQAGEMVKALPCGHSFHADEIDNWLKTNPRCPLCRRRIDE